MAYITPHTWTSEQATVALMNEINNNLRVLFPVGKYIYVARAATTAETFIDNCWLECNGFNVLRATYPDLNTLFSGLGYPFGTVDGTHMNLPPADGRTMVSQASGGHADVNALGDSDGLAKGSRTPKLVAHDHSQTAHTHGPGSYGIPLAQLPDLAAQSGTGQFSTAGGAKTVTGTSASGGGGTTGTGGSDSGNYLVGGVWLIKAVA